MARWFVGRSAAVLIALAVGATGCAAFSAEDDRVRAEEIAERVAPGQLEVVSARNLYPQDGGAEISFRIKGDADAVVRFHVDAEKDTCRRRPCEELLAEALAEARADAEEFRLLRREFAACGYEVHGVRPSVADPWIAARVDGTTVRSVLTSVGECLARWARARTGEHPPSYSVLIASPETARDLPEGDRSQPTLARLSATKRMGALSKHTYLRATYAWPATGVDPASGVFSLARPFAERQRFANAVQGEARTWLRTAGPRLPEAVVSEYSGVWRLVPGRVDRVTGWVLYCDRPEGEHPPCTGRHALAVTADLSGRLVGEPRVFRDVREGNGPLVLPRAPGEDTTDGRS
ncbi:hypothetical protein AB0A76_21980 [Streptomyces exfoliatus]|uniref:Lipoprotein n=1 Tax=Streptomyces exfoliatus TaxID=1905 RepID=A0ABV3D1Q7_STREX